MVNHFLISSRKPIGTALGSSCFKSGTGKTGLLLILMISDQCTYTCLHHNTLFYAFISYILIFDKFSRFCLIGEWHLCINELHYGQKNTRLNHVQSRQFATWDQTFKPIFHQKPHLRWLPNVNKKKTNNMKSTCPMQTKPSRSKYEPYSTVSY